VTKISLPARLLLIRFSSFGDIVQAVGVPKAFQTHLNSSGEGSSAAEVDWLVREDFRSLLEGNPFLRRVLSFQRKSGLLGLIQLAWSLAGTGGYTHLYDAHNNLRSKIFCLVFRIRSPGVHFLRRPKQRLRRFLFFNFGLPTLEMPFRGANSFHAPLTRWGLPPRVDRGQQFFSPESSPESLPPAVLADIRNLKAPLIAVAPSAAWEMKRWPIEHWKTLVQALPEASFILLGGPTDTFLSEIHSCAPAHTLNLAGRLTLAQNAAVFSMADLVIANDTGLLHVADQMERPTFALIGPTAFGYPSHTSSRTLEIELPCKPCSKDGRGGCKNTVYQRCLVELTPERVAREAREVLQTGRTQ
jgi:ADP-heptose:LPS heptosyltransferase